MAIHVAVLEEAGRFLPTLMELADNSLDFVCVGGLDSRGGLMRDSLPDILFASLDRSKASLDRSKASLDRSKASLDRSKASLEVFERIGETPARLIVLAREEDLSVESMLEWLRAGCRGFLDYAATVQQTEAAIRAVLEGAMHIPPRAFEALLKPLSIPSLPQLSLSPAEHRVVEFLANRRSDKEIAAELGVEPGTVHSHVQRIFRKLRVHRRGDAVREYHRLRKQAGENPLGAFSEEPEPQP